MDKIIQKRFGIMRLWYQFLIAIVALSIMGFYTSAIAQIRETAPGTSNAITNVLFNSLPGGKLEVVLQFNRPLEISKPIQFNMPKPPQLVLDFPNTATQLPQKHYDINIGPGRSFQAIEAGGRTRILIELRRNVSYETSVKGRQVIVEFEGGSAKEKQLARQSFASKNLDITKTHAINNIDFRRINKTGGQIVISFSKPGVEVDLRRQGGELIAEFLDTTIPTRLERRLDVTDFGTPVDILTMKNDGPNASMAISLHGRYEHMAYQVNNSFIIDVNPEADDTSLAGDSMKKHYTGERISLNFQNIQVRAVLQLLADFTGLNLVTSDSVGGSVTLRLHNVPWDQALDIILRTRGLAKRQTDNVLLVAPARELANRERNELRTMTQIQELAPLHSELIQVNYADASQIAGLLQSQQAGANSLLSARGSLSTDVRTNTIWIQDTADKLREIRELVSKLDVPVKQVLIEARVVTVDKTLDNKLGIQFGLTNPNIPFSGTLGGANTIAGGSGAAVVGTTSRLNVNLPVIGSDAGRIGVALARLGHGVLLDLELSALENSGRGEIISSPRVITANQHTANIESGEEIPFQQTTSSGATTVAFKKAVLGLNVTPQITPDNKVVLTLNISQDSRSSKPEILGVPAIDTQAVETQVLVDNGGTVVLGGIYKRTYRDTSRKIPFLSKLPIIGNLFQDKSDVDNQSELLIFITPKIIQQTTFTR